MELNIISDCTESQVNKVVKVTRITVAAVRNEKYMFVKQRGKGTMELPGTQLVKGENTAKALRRECLKACWALRSMQHSSSARIL